MKGDRASQAGSRSFLTGSMTTLAWPGASWLFRKASATREMFSGDSVAWAWAAGLVRARPLYRRAMEVRAARMMTRL
jgi:hypothetical protein